MNPLNVILASVLKWLLAAGVVSGVIAGISVAVTKAIKRKRKNSEINFSNQIDKVKGNPKKSIKLYTQTKGLTSTPEIGEPVASELEKKVRARQAEVSNIDRFLTKGKSKVLSSVQDPRLSKLIEDYVSKADLKNETDFSKVKIEHGGEEVKKSEVLVAPDIFVKTLFIPKVCYECAITEDQKYPVILTYQAPETKKGEPAEVAELVLENRQMATEYAIDFIGQMRPNLAAKAEMDISKLTEVKNRDQDSSK